MKTLEQILIDLELAAAVIAQSGIPDASQGAALADVLLKIAQAAIKAHQDILGEPIDLDKLQPID